MFESLQVTFLTSKRKITEISFVLCCILGAKPAQRVIT
jgi:hypothetical protein